MLHKGTNKSLESLQETDGKLSFIDHLKNRGAFKCQNVDNINIMMYTDFFCLLYFYYIDKPRWESGNLIS